MNEAISAMLMAFPALFSIINPVAGVFIFREATADRSRADRHMLARRVGIYSFIVMMVSLVGGPFVLEAFGISYAALRIAGGIVLSLFAWELLGSPEKRQTRKQEQAAGAERRPPDDVAFFPLTLPLTTGPGTIAVAVALGAGHKLPGSSGFFLGVAVAALAMSALIGVMYWYADRISDVLGQTGSRTVTRLSAFLLFCIGVQLLINGVTDALKPLL